MSNGFGGFAQGMAQGAQATMGLISQYQGIQRQKKVDEQNDAKFQAWQNDQAFKADTQRQQAALADDMQNGVVNNDRTAAGLNTASAGNPDAQQWTPQQVAGLTRGPGGAFDPNAGPYLPAQRDALKDSDKYTRMAGLAARTGDYGAASQLGEAGRTSKIREGVSEFMKEYDTSPDKFDQHISRYANAKTSSLMLGDRDKKGYRQVLIRDANSDAKPVNLSPVDMRQLAMGYAHMQAGDNDGAMAIFKGVNKDLAEAIARDNDAVTKTATTDNTATHYANTDDYNQARLGIESSRLSLEGRRVANAERLERMGQVRQYQDPKTGEIKEYYPVVGKNGVSWEEVPRPQGLVPYRAQRPIAEADVQKLTEQIMASDKKLAKDQVGARAEAVRQLQTQGDPRPTLSLNLGDIAKNLPGAAQPAPQAQQGGLRMPQDDGPTGGAAWRQEQAAIAQGYVRKGKGNGGLFGSDEYMYENPQTGDRKWASQFDGR